MPFTSNGCARRFWSICCHCLGFYSFRLCNEFNACSTNLIPDPILKDHVGFVFTAIRMAEDGRDLEAAWIIELRRRVIKKRLDFVSLANIKRKPDHRINPRFAETCPVLVFAPVTLEYITDISVVSPYCIECVIIST